MRQEQGAMRQEIRDIQASINLINHRERNHEIYSLNKTSRDRGSGFINLCYNVAGELPPQALHYTEDFAALNVQDSLRTRQLF